MLRHARPSRGAQGPTPSGDVRVGDADQVYVAEGDVVANKYQVDRVLGSGGVGFVLAARHVELGGYFALKFLKRRFLDDQAIVERFTREAKAACRIQSEYTARVYDVGAHDGAPFIVMEHLVGRDLAAVLAERGALAVDEAIEHALQACAGLAVAHANGIVHRDIKPENLFLVDQDGLPTIKLLDFGISKFALPEQSRPGEWPPEGEEITGTLICGTPLYMSPEQIRSTATVDSRSDVWSLGMVLYELLASVPAFQGEGVIDICEAILKKEPPRLCDVRPEVPTRLADVVSRCLEKDPANRFANVAELAIALLPFAPPRALAIAERSAWIRSAAIHTLGSSGGEGRNSSSYAAISSRAPSVLAASSQPLAPAPSTPSSATGNLRFGAVAVFALAVFGLIGYRWTRAEGGRAVNWRTTASVTESPSSALLSPAVPAREAEKLPEPPPGALPDAPPAAVLGGPARVSPPAAVLGGPARVSAPARPHVVAKAVRAQPSPKTAPSVSGSSLLPDMSARVFIVPPPVAPGSRDLGY
jgi:serine/threonine protein kinase